MLPDFSKFKKQATRTVVRFIDQKFVAVTPLIQNVQRIRQHEGSAGTVVRADGSADKSEPRLESFEFVFDREQMRRFDMNVLLEKLTDLAKRLGDAHAKLLLEKASEAADSVGNVVRGNGPLTKDNLLDVLRKMQIDFDPQTQQMKSGYTWVMHPDMAAKVVPQMKEWEKDPEFNAEYERIMTRQREAWHDREANRKLVG